MTLLLPVLPAAVVEGHPVLYDVVLVLAVAVALGMLLQRLGQSVLPGYLLAGLVLGGPGSLGLVHDVDAFSLMGEVGIALLLFTIGLELPWQKVQRLGGRPLAAGGVQVVATVVLVSPLLVALGLDTPAAVAMAMAISLSSTAVVMRLLHDRAETDSVHGLASTGMVLAQDLAVVVFLLAVPLLGSDGGAGGFGATAVLAGTGIALAKLAGLVALMYVLELVVMRRVFARSGPGPRQELLALTSIVVSLGAVGVCLALDLSPALGGFVAGVLMADAPYADQVRSEIATIRTGLVALFFAWIGMLADITWMLENAALIGAAFAAVILVKAALAYGSMRLLGIPAIAAVISAAALAQLGEFSFAIVAAARNAGLVDDDLFQLAISTSLLTLLVTPSLLAGTARLVRARAERAGVSLAGEAAASGPSGHVVVVGAGPAGRAVTAALLAAGREVCVVELNPRGVRGSAARASGHVFGDAARPEILVRAGVMNASLLVVTIPETASVRTIIRHARELCPELQIVARGRYNLHVEDVREAGADEVVDEENVTGQQLAHATLRRLAVE